MKKIVAKTLQDALLKASEELRCSVVDLEYEIVQNPSSGLLGIGRKEAIIIVDDKRLSPNVPLTPDSHDILEAKDTPKAPVESSDTQPISQEKDFEETIWGEKSKVAVPTNDTKDSKPVQSLRDSQEIEDLSDSKHQSAHASHKSNITTSEPDMSQADLPPKKPRTKQPYSKEAFDEIERDIVELFSYLPFEIDSIKVELYKENVVAVTLNGPDCALLIGEKGYRYKAISYLLFNWINPKYGYGVRLEIAEFLRNQEQMIDTYLDGIIKIVRTKGVAQTKVLDGVLAYIALGKLRVIFPQKYISFRTNDEGQRYIVISDFKPA